MNPSLTDEQLTTFHIVMLGQLEELQARLVQLDSGGGELGWLVVLLERMAVRLREGWSLCGCMG